MKRFLALFCLVILNISFSQAAVTINVVESGGDVVATANGSINTAGLSGPRASFYKTGVVIGLDRDPTDPLSLMIVGPAADPDFWVGAIPPPSHFSTGAYFDDSSNGGTLAVGAFKSLRRGNAIYVPQGYSSGTALDGTSTWSSQTFASLGLTPGTYQWTWGSGESADSLTLVIGEPDSTYSVGGSVSGLTGTGLALQNNGTEVLAIAADGSFTFLTELTDSSAYLVTVSTQPTGQTCTVSNESGTIASADVTDVTVVCVDDVIPTYSVGGSVSGLTGTGLALQNNGTEVLAIAADGPFTFLTELTDATSYAVTISAQPTGQTCTVSNGGGTIATADVTNVAVTCVTDTYSVGGTVSGLTGTGLALQNNGADTLAVATDGPFVFLTELTGTSTYAVTISTQPTGQTCTVSNGSGTIATADVTSIAVACVSNPIYVNEVPIPTLDRYGLALLMLLMMCIGAVGIRRIY